MDVFAEFLDTIAQTEQRERIRQVLAWVCKKYPRLVPKIGWNQPMFTDHGTFIVGFSVAKHHLAIAPEKAAIERFSDAIARAGYTHTANLIRVGWDQPTDFALLDLIIKFNIADKAHCQSFWRK